jgi:hypothetical protein
MSCDAPDSSYGGYGKMCSKSYTSYATTAAPPKCLKAGDECDSSKPTCCDKMTCTKGYGYNAKYTCEMHATTPPPTTTTAKCLAAGSKCGDMYSKCCAGSECRKEGYESKCVAVY